MQEEKEINIKNIHLNMTITSDDLKLIEKFHNILNQGMYCDSNQVTDEYNKVVRQSQNLPPVNNTNCATCIRHRVLELVNYATKIKEESKDAENKKITKGD